MTCHVDIHVDCIQVGQLVINKNNMTQRFMHMKVSHWLSAIVHGQYPRLTLRATEVYVAQIQNYVL
jgi:hypothetical protein